jgi:D-beta-D-heptose 7-phosphate kinase/D-beta-D-heptose 1-phosphate adenosyltransferase
VTAGPAGVGRERVRAVLDAFAGRRVAVVGDVMLDRFVWGSVSRISPEAPVPVVRVERENDHLGGAANVAANITSLGGRAILLSSVGDDAAGERLAAAAAAAGVDGRFVRDPSRSTTVKTRVIARSQQVVRVDRETEDALPAASRDALARLVSEALAEADTLVLSDYDKGVFSRELLAVILPEAHRRGLPVVVDPKLTFFDAFQPVTIITPNQAEAARAAAMEVRTDEDCLVAARRILERLRTRAVLVTRGERGVLLLERGEEPTFVPAVALEVFDVTGAGDTVASVVALSLAAGASLLEAAVIANHAGGVVVAKVGTATLSPAEILEHLEKTARAPSA